MPTTEANQNPELIPVPSSGANTNAVDQSPDPQAIPHYEIANLERDGLNTTHFNGALDQIIESESKRYGDKAVIRLISSFLKDVNDRTTIVEKNLIAEKIKNDNLQSQNMILRVELATIKATVKEGRKFSYLLKFAMFSGSILFTRGISEFNSDNTSGIIQMIIGLVMVLLSIFNGKDSS